MHPEYKIFCENVKNLRILHNLSEKEMAEIAGISVKTLLRIENFDPPKWLSVRIIYMLYTHFHITPSELFTEGMKKD